jgi:hypothetical protein
MIRIRIALWLINKGAKLLPKDYADETFIVNCIRTKKITFESEQRKDYMDIAEDICNKDK